MSAFFQLHFEVIDDFAVKCIERTYPSEVVIMLAHHF